MTDLERVLIDLAEYLGVGTEKSDMVLCAIARIQHLEGRVADLEEARVRDSWITNPDRMGGQFTDEERRRSDWS